jgi:hypothetical protein
MLIYAVRGIQGRGDNRGSKKDALLTGPPSPPGAGLVGGGAEDPAGVGPVAQGDKFSVSSATCFIQSGKGSAFSRVIDVDPIILFRSGSFGINDFTFVAEIA